MIVAVPAATALTRPDEDTVAIAALLVDHATARPVSVLPFASRVMAESCAVCPIDSDDVGGVTATVATGATDTAVTVTVAHPCFDVSNADVAHTCELAPAASAVTSPAALTEAVVATEEVQLTAVEAPASATTVAASVAVPPTVRGSVAGLTVTLVTRGTVTVMTAVFVSVIVPAVADAVTVAAPAATAVTSPVADTDATPDADDDHDTAAAIGFAL